MKFVTPVSFGRYAKDPTAATNPISDSCVDTWCIDCYPVLETTMRLSDKVLFKLGHQLPRRSSSNNDIS